jgi:hypothetical protein
MFPVNTGLRLHSSLSFGAVSSSFTTTGFFSYRQLSEFRDGARRQPGLRVSPLIYLQLVS